MIDMTEGCEHCDAAPGEPCDPVAVPHGRHAVCTIACAWKQRQASDKMSRLPIIVEAPRPESGQQAFPTYHELLDHLCAELGVPGSPSFLEAVAYLKRRLEKGSR